MKTETINNRNASIKRFLNPLQSLREIILDAKQQENIPLAFFGSSARQHLFYLEALCRIYKNINNKKTFKKLRSKFKSLEDQLGKVDYYEAFHKELSADKNFPTVLLNQLFQNYQTELNNLYSLLLHDDWLDEKEPRIEKSILRLDKVEWLNADAEKKAIAKTIRKEIKKILKDYKSGKLTFEKLEAGVHEFRRNIRWISIYAQALDGLIQIKTDDEPRNLQKYLTAKVVESPFNKMPENKAGLSPILISRSAFYALSWMIAESGNLKDEGLMLICIEDLMKETGFVDNDKISSEAKKLAKNVRLTPSGIKSKMKVLVDEFIYRDKVLDILRIDLKNND
ncbi:hypothetical protein I5M32_16125 [Pedobacter sp. SD-b]|uniref:Uncharacterized protein n=1 Tax=Pedobacter segetis TaxID=2793069 RepID=A0ABS1BNM4_9SPHI|nr:hypothetical protein [Pedobacter segetis]MBK0384494.1 hypothetical protein [Pedobacter segetis]